MTLVYIPLIFYLPWIVFGAMFIQFFVVKSMLIYVHKRPVQMGNDMALFFLKTIPWILAVYSTSLFYWFYFLDFYGFYYFIVILVITLLLKLIISWVVEKCLPRFKHESERGVASDKFTHDYD